jgi:hypothetical protein
MKKRKVKLKSTQYYFVGHCTLIAFLQILWTKTQWIFRIIVIVYVILRE